MTTPDGTATSPHVLDYYARNWERIANCYALNSDGLPVDPAWYRRRLYQDFLARVRPQTVLDIGCGGGWTVLDALELGLDARGIEPVAPLCEHGMRLLADKGHDAGRITRRDLAALETQPDASVDCVALLSVLPHVPRERWNAVHRDIHRVLRPGGSVVAAYRNELFDLYTFNSFTIEFYDRTLWAPDAFAPLRSEQHVGELKQLVTNPDLPGPYFTASQDKSFGQLDRMKSNPLTLPSYLAESGLRVDRTRFYHFHCVPPLMAPHVPEFAAINHQLELTLSDDWRGHFMAAMFLVEAARA